MKKSWLCGLLFAAVSAATVFAAANAGTNAGNNAGNVAGAAVNNSSGAASSSAEPAASSPVASPSPSPSPSPSLTNSAMPPMSNVGALLNVLVGKGVLALSEANAIRNAAPGSEFQLLVEALSRKGVLSAADLAGASMPAQPAMVAVPAAVMRPASASAAYSLAAYDNAEPQSSSSQMAPAPQGSETPKPSPPAVIPAVAPIRVFPIDPPKTGGLAGIKLGPIMIAPYGFIKATAIHDSSDPNGDDFPFPGIFLTTPQVFATGPTTDPAFHLKARSTRFGLNLEWPDISKKLTLTGKIEGDFEGNFSEVDNRDVSSIRSNEPQLRLAFVRMDYHASDTTDVFFKGGQDWTLFASGALPNIMETTFLGAYWGVIYERSPQMTVGMVQTLNKAHNVKFEPQFGIMMPSSGQILKLGSLGLAGQIGEGEREGADSDRPEWEGRAALSWQLDPAKGVAPAQVALAGFRGSRKSIVPNSSYITGGVCDIPTNYCSAFPNGFTASSKMYGGQLTVQLPTRWFTLVGSAYRGGDLRFYFGGQINSYATDTSGLTGIEGPFSTLDGGPLAAAGGAVLGTNGSGQVVVAPQKPIRSFGGYLNLGIPLSRLFNADPKGHNAGWQLYLHVGKDQVVDRDLNNPNFTANANSLAPLPLLMGKMAAATLYYKLNNWASFGFEQSIYATRAEDHINLYNIAGVQSNEWQDHRTEFGPIFTF